MVFQPRPELTVIRFATLIEFRKVIWLIGIWRGADAQISTPPELADAKRLIRGGEAYFLRRCVAPTEFDADFVQLCFHRAVECVIRGRQRVGQLLDAACTKDDRSYCTIRQQPSD
jgi:hypothetical protein